MVRNVGFHSNVARGKRISSILETDVSAKEYKRNWARLIQKIYEVDPLTCPRCFSEMRVKSIIERPEIVKKYFNTSICGRPGADLPPQTHSSKSGIDTSDSQLPSSEDHLYCDPEYPIEVYVS